MDTWLGALIGFIIAIALLSLAKAKNGRLAASNDILLNMEYDASLIKVKEAIRLFNLKLQQFDSDKGILIALSGMTFRSLGEVITISARRDPNGTALTIQSRPAIPFTLLDYGRNKTNVEALTKLIQN